MICQKQKKKKLLPVWLSKPRLLGLLFSFALLRRVSQPRSCILYGSHKANVFREKTELENLVRKKLEQHQVVNPGCISLWRTEGDPSQWEKLDSFALN